MLALTALGIPAVAQVDSNWVDSNWVESNLVESNAADPAQPDWLLGDALASMVEVRRSGGFDPFTLSLIDDAVRAVRGESTKLHRLTLRMQRVTRGEEIVQEAPGRLGYPMLTMAIDPATPVVPVGLRTTLARGEAAMGEITARIRGAVVGDVIDLESLDGTVVPIRIGAIVPDEEIRWSEILIGDSVIPGLEIDRPYSVMAWGTNEALLAAAIRIWTSDPGVRVLDGLGGPPTDPVLPMAVVKERFGEFAVAPAGGDSVEIDQAWRDAWIVTVDFPIVGVTRCHRMVVPYIRAALDEVDRSGLAAELDRADFQIAGGCYNPRFNRGGDPGYSLSRHSWGIAVDFNPSTNQYGEEPTLSLEVVEIFRRWGFSWGGGWSVPDGMHFEWFSLPLVYAAACSDLTAVQGSAETVESSGAVDLVLWMLLPASGTCQ
ncbi:MAG: M15 family metallopeptidase [Acidimicrobiia bacterium]